MFNARVTYNNFGGRLSESTFAPDDEVDTKHNHSAVLELIDTSPIDTKLLSGDTVSGSLSLEAHTAIVAPTAMVTFLKSYRWSNSSERVKQRPMELQIEFLQRVGAQDPQIDDWLLVAPQINTPRATIKIQGIDFGVIYRERTELRFGTYNDPKHRAFAEDIAYGEVLANANDQLLSLRKARRGVMIYYVITDEKTKKPKPPYSTGFTLLFPKNDIRSPITFGVRRPDLSKQATVPIGP
jgi:hypothetical protein